MFTDGRTDGQTEDGRQANRYIPRTFRSGDHRKGEAIAKNESGDNIRE